MICNIEWYNKEVCKPEPFKSVLVYIPKPLPSVHEGFIDNDGNFHVPMFLRESIFGYKVTYWASMPEYTKIEDIK